MRVLQAPALDLALGLGMIGRAANVLHVSITEPFGQIAVGGYNFRLVLKWIRFLCALLLAALANLLLAPKPTSA